MPELSAFWVGAAQADAGHALRRFLGERYDPIADWTHVFAGASVDDIVHHPDALVTPAQARVWREAKPEEVPVGAVIRGSPGYPARLGGLEDAPPVLFVEGDISALSPMASLGVVGSRECSPYAAGVGREISARAAAAGAVVVSGLARGIDAACHQAALAVGRTVAVLGHGLGFTSPASNRSLRRDIVARGGAVVSSWPARQPPERWTFPRRNRWIAALSDIVVVAQAGERSGALITAREALELERPVYVVPGRLGDNMEGGLRLVQDGANVISSIDELVALVAGAGVTFRRREWLEQLFFGASLDDVAKARCCSISELLRELAVLEGRGEVARRAGGIYVPGPVMTLL
jgi:DNA processing protein